MEVEEEPVGATLVRLRSEREFGLPQPPAGRTPDGGRRAPARPQRDREQQQTEECERSGDHEARPLQRGGHRQLFGRMPGEMRDEPAKQTPRWGSFSK